MRRAVTVWVWTASMLFGCGRLGFGEPALVSTEDAGATDGDVPSGCNSGTRDGDEEGVDCGGACPAPCSGAFSCDTQTDLPPGECWALVDLYAATAGEGWVESAGWLTERPCRWFGVLCVAGHVGAIRLPQNGLSGSLRASIRAFGALEELTLESDGGTWTAEAGCEATNRNTLGRLPEELGALTELRHLQLACAGIEGSLPPFRGTTNLISLDLDSNQLSGSAPAELGNLTNLTELYLSRNQLSGSVPAELGNLTSLTGLDLSLNQLSGSVPAELGNLTNLTGLDLSLNQLSGSVPAELGNLTSLTWLSLYSNQLSGSVPAELGNLTNLTELYLYGNQLSGSVPAELGNLTSVTWFALSANQLSGELPPSLMSIPGTSLFHLRGNTCLTATGAGFLAWLAEKDPLWNDGC